MKQVALKLKNGRVQVLEVPMPLLGKGMILVRNRHSLISAGRDLQISADIALIYLMTFMQYIAVRS